MDLDRLQELIKKYRENMNYYRNTKNAYNETECRDEYISPLLECFGWDVQNAKGRLPQYKEVVVERFSSGSERPDYTLTLNGVSKIFVEAKKPSVNILVENEPAMQARRYGWNANHAMTILTNFENMLIYDVTNRPEEGDAACTSLYRKYYFEEYIKKYAEIYELISRDNVYNGKYDTFVKSNFQISDKYNTQIDEIFLAQINDWRLMLGRYLYHKDSKYRNIRVLNDTVQDFINQIIFLRICEDRKLPLYKKLYEMAYDRKELQSALTDTFKDADMRYNSGLFKGENPIFNLNSEIIFQMIESLYYPKTPYLFTIIEPNVLGKIYEAFLTESLIWADGEITLAKKNQFKYKSVVSTPVEIVKYIVKSTLEPVCKGKTPHDIPRSLNGGVGRDVPDATSETWYKYGRTQALTTFVNTPKLIVRVLSKEPMYAYDEKNMLIASGGTAGYCAISRKRDSQYALEYIQAWLAHPYTESVFQVQGSDFENGFTARGTFLLKKLPFVELDFEDEKQKRLYDEVVSKTRRIYELNEQMLIRPDKASMNVLEKEKKKYIVDIQKLIEKVYRQKF